MSSVEERFGMFAGAVQQLAEHAPPAHLSDEQRVSNAKKVFLRKLDGDMAVELEACVHCGQCAEACHFYVQTHDPKYTPIHKLDLLKRVYRRELSPVRWIHRLYTRDITAAELMQWQELVYDSCTECGRCGMVCPMGINIASMVNVMRQGLASAGLIPAEMHALEVEQYKSASLFGVGADQLRGALEQLRSSGLDVPLDKPKAEVLLLTSVVDILLFNDSLVSSIKIMNHLGVDWTFRSEGFEAANFGLLSGCEPLQKVASERVIRAAEACGAKLVITPECGHAYPSMRWDAANEHGEPLNFDVVTISEYLGQQVEAGKLRLNPIGRQKKVTFHDPCKVARHSGSIKEPRSVLRALGVDFREVESTGEMNWCCGGGAGVFLLNRASPCVRRHSS